MPQIRLGGIDNLPKIALGDKEVQEVFLGNILVWQNNLAPHYTALIWDGTTISAPNPFTEFKGDATSNTGPVDGGNSETRNISVVVSGIVDPDNLNPDFEGTDYLVGYRIQHPDGSWIAGDPNSSSNRSDGAPISDYGDILPGTNSTWDPTEEEFTNGTSSVTSTLPVTLSAYDSDNNVVDSADASFKDAGMYKIYIVDSRGGESDPAEITVTLVYQVPAGNASATSLSGFVSKNSNAPSSFTNATIGGPSSTTLSYSPSGGPLTETEASKYLWSCISGCSNADSTGATYTVAIPQEPSGAATPARVRLTTLGRSYTNNNITERTTIGDFYFRSGAACSAGWSVGNQTYSLSNGCAQFGGVASGSPTVSCSGDGCSFSSFTGSINGGTYSNPNPGCPPGGNPLTATVSVSGGTISIGGSSLSIGGGSFTYTGSTPSASYTCTLAGLPSGVRSISASTSESSATCTDTTPATNPTAVNVSGTCFVSSASIGCSSCIFSTGRLGGSVSGTCAAGTIPRNSTSSASISSGSCGALTGNGVTYSTSSGPNAEVFSENIGFFNVRITGSAQRNSSPDTSAIGAVRMTSNTCEFSSSFFDSLGNASQSQPVSWSDFITHSASANDKMAGDSLTCTATLEYTVGGYTGTVNAGTVTYTGTFS